ncbi:DUF262 domain-containing protein [Akkermansia muciniphila]|uniref:GmrSD restriction endonucleases N-terminal domain-containing protein n=1 Tax=Akkermansia muciniphila TaxID=239935 RepID=A0AAP8NLD2_9BACT|nr:DUF262 domain-containing protein [Akkermansia muciniphila]PNC56402.1 hypothetical protein CXU09_07275 [Akkermansia muciniphila]
MNNIENKVIRRASTQDVSWFLDINSTGQLELSPSYQRKSVWTLKDQRFFLDTIFRGYPCPPIYLHKTLQEGKSIYAVVDGKQRLETVIRFFSNKISLPPNLGDDRLNGKKWKNIKSDAGLASRFMDYVFPVEFITLPFDNSIYVNDVFDRLNRNSKLLNPQELRHAKFEGWFITFVEDEISNQFWEKCKISTKAKSKRMADIQFLSELLICVIRKEIIGFDQEVIDLYYSMYDDLNDFDHDNEWRLPEIDSDEIRAQYNQYRNKIEALTNSHNFLIGFLKDNKTFYSIWSYLVLEDMDPTIPSFSAEKYISLLTEVEKLNSTSDPAEAIAAGVDANIVNYHAANKGATTELPERKARFEAMKAYFQR